MLEMVCAHLLEYSMVNGYPELRATLPLSATKNEDWFKQKTKKLPPNIRSGFWVTTRRLCPIIPGEEEQEEEEQQEEIINTTSGNSSFTILSYSSSAESSPTLASRWWFDGREPCRGVSLVFPAMPWHGSRKVIFEIAHRSNAGLANICSYLWLLCFLCSVESSFARVLGRRAPDSC